MHQKALIFWGKCKQGVQKFKYLIMTEKCNLEVLKLRHVFKIVVLFFSHQDLIAFLDKMVSMNTLHTLESKLMSNQMISKEAEAGVFACFSLTAPLKAIFVSSSPSRGSPWWATTGAAPWCGTWLSFSQRGSGREHTHPVPLHFDPRC